MEGQNPQEHPSSATIYRPLHPSYTLDTLASKQSTTAAASSLRQLPPDESESAAPELRPENESEPPPSGLKLFAVEPYLFLKESINFTLFYEDTLRTFELFDEEGARVLIALEVKQTKGSSCCSCRCPSLRGSSFSIPVVNEEGVELFRFNGTTAPKLLKLKRRARVDVTTRNEGAGLGEEELLGRVEEVADEPNHVKCYAVHCGGGEPAFLIKSTPGVGRIGGGIDMDEAEFQIQPSGEGDEDAWGKISLRWGNLLDSIFPTATLNYGIQFPPAVDDWRTRATLLGAAFLLNYQFYERKKFVVGAETWRILDE